MTSLSTDLEEITIAMHNLDNAFLGAWTFLASPHSADTCGINGLPLTPNSIRVLGKFQKLKTLQHGNLCSYLDIIRGRHERLMVICEHYKDNLSKKSNEISDDLSRIASLAFSCLDALDFLHTKGVVHRCLTPKYILITPKNQIKLSNFGLYYITEYGTTVPFPIGVPKYMSPEALAIDSKIWFDQQATNFAPCGPKTDVWSLGMIILELYLKKPLWTDLSLKEIFSRVLELGHLESGVDVVVSIFKTNNVLCEMDENLKSFLECCLHPNPSQRPSCRGLLQHAFLAENGLGLEKRVKVNSLSFPSMELQCLNYIANKATSVITDHIAQCPIEIVYYLWQLAGGDVEAELKKQSLIKAKPSICALTNLVLEDGEEFGQKKDQAFLVDDTVIILSLDQLRQRLMDLDPRIYYPTLEHSPIGPKSLFSYVEEAAKLPVVIREKDIEYQLNRVILFNRLLTAYPYKRPQIIQEAKKDIPPLYRAKIWAALLEIEGDVQGQYEEIDKETPTPTDRQIEVDIPRCHQYNELMAAPSGHAKFKRLLKAWVVSHPQYVYWQGLDSLCAPFLYLNFNDEALAYACLKSFIPKYLHNFFLKDNSAVIQEYLAVFSHLIAYHDAELTNHLDEIGFIPELYAIPWFLTMYTHVFPLHKIFHLWDTLLLGNSSFPLFIGVAILQQLRNGLLSFGFNECILLFSDMPEIDIERCVQDSIKLYCGTPKSATFRQHQKPMKKADVKIESISLLGMTPITLETLKSETGPRISGEEILELIECQRDVQNSTYPSNVKKVIVDVRPVEDFSRGAIPDSISVPYLLDGSTNYTPLIFHKGKMIWVVGSARNNHSSKFANELIKQSFPRVSILHGGIDVLRSSGILVVRPEVQ